MKYRFFSQLLLLLLLWMPLSQVVACPLERSGFLGSPMERYPQLSETEGIQQQTESARYEIPADLLCPQRTLLQQGNLTLKVLHGRIVQVQIEQVSDALQLHGWVVRHLLESGEWEEVQQITTEDRMVKVSTTREGVHMRYQRSPLGEVMLERIDLEQRDTAVWWNRQLLLREGR